MSEPLEQMRLTNTSTRPVELHLASGVVVIPAQEEMTCGSEDLDNAQIKVLTDRGVLRIRPTSASEEQPEQPPELGRRRRGSGRTRNPS
jgi:hypothetical protein